MHAEKSTYFVVTHGTTDATKFSNCKMRASNGLVYFTEFDEEDNVKKQTYYPLVNVQKIIEELV